MVWSSASRIRHRRRLSPRRKLCPLRFRAITSRAAVTPYRQTEGMKRPVSQGSEEDSERRSPKSTQGVGKLLMDLVTRTISSFTSGGCVNFHAAILIPYEEVRHSGHSRRVVVVSTSADFLHLDKRRTGGTSLTLDFSTEERMQRTASLAHAPFFYSTVTLESTRLPHYAIIATA